MESNTAKACTETNSSGHQPRRLQSCHVRHGTDGRRKAAERSTRRVIQARPAQIRYSNSHPEIQGQDVLNDRCGTGPQTVVPSEQLRELEQSFKWQQK